jgi:hypothetical protein
LLFSHSIHLPCLFHQPVNRKCHAQSLCLPVDNALAAFLSHIINQQHCSIDQRVSVALLPSQQCSCCFSLSHHKATTLFHQPARKFFFCFPLNNVRATFLSHIINQQPCSINQRVSVALLPSQQCSCRFSLSQHKPTTLFHQPAGKYDFTTQSTMLLPLFSLRS